MNLRPGRFAAAVTALALGGGLLASAPATAADPVTLTVLSINDFHGRIDDDTVQWAGTIEQLRAAGGEKSTMLLSAGDNIGASLFASASQDDVPTIDVTNALDMAVSAVGNHEFDRGYDDLVDRVVPASDYPILGANVERADGSPALESSTVLEVDGLTVGVVGAVTQETPALVTPGGIAGLTFTDPVDALNAEVAELNALPEPPDVIIAAYHEGASEAGSTFEQAVAATETFRRIAQETDPSVDAIFTGHTHQEYAWDAPLPGGGEGTRPILQAGEYGDNVGRIALTIDPDTDEITGYEQEIVPQVTTPDEELVATYPRVAEVDRIVDDALAVADEIGSEPIGEITADITTAFADGKRDDRASESALGNLVANAQLAGVSQTQAGADLSVVNPGGLRSDLLFEGEGGDGVVTFAEANAVLPFTNNLSSVTLTGAQLKKVFEQQWQRPATPDGPAPSRPYLQLGTSDNVSYTFDPTRERDDRITSLQVDGEDVDPTASYRVAVPSFLASGGDNFHAFTEGTAVDTGLLDYEVWIDYLDATSPVSPDFARHAVRLEGLEASYTAGEALAVELPALDLTSLGSPQNTSVEAALEIGEDVVELGSFDAADGRAVIDAEIPADLDGTARLLAVAEPTQTVAVSAPFEITAAGGGSGGDGSGGGGTPPAPSEPTDPATKDAITVEGGADVAPGETVTITVGTQYAGQDVDVWLFSDPVFLGTHTVSAAGTVTVTLPEGVEPGEHTLAVYDGDGELIGYQSITVADPDAASGGSDAGDGGWAMLPDAGTPVGLAIVLLAVALLLAGGVALTVGARRSRRA